MAAHAGLCLAWSETPKDMFCRVVAQMLYSIFNHVMRKPVFCHMRTSAFVIRCLDNIIHVVSICKISNLLIVSIAEQASLRLTWSQTPKTNFLMPGLNYGNCHVRHLILFLTVPDTVAKVVLL